MRIKTNISRIQLILVTLIWVLIFAIPVLFAESGQGVNWNNIFKIWKEYSILMMVFLINRFLLMPYLFFRDKRGLYFTSIVGVIVLFSSFLFLFDGKKREMPRHHPIPPAKEHRFKSPPPRHQQKPFIPPVGNLFIMSILLIGFDSGLIFYSRWVQSEQKKLKAEKESADNKMAFLQNQISPHFFMNTLNNIHALVDIDTQEAKSAIIKLSKMMDYMLYESNSSHISLKQEMEFIKSYVELMKLRFTDDVDLILDIPEELPQVNIPPLLTISYIENAFKYGVSYEVPSYIHMHVNIKGSRFYIKIENSINQEKKRSQNYGIGLDNTKRRLDLLFGNEYRLSILNDESKFIVNLDFPL